MMKKSFAVLMLAFVGNLCVAQTPQLDVNWGKVERISKSTPTLQVVGNPMLRKTGAMHDGSFAALKDLGADYVRYVPWFPYPKLVVAELKPPADGKTYWDFKLPDSTMAALMEATQGHSVVINFSTTPVWM